MVLIEALISIALDYRRLPVYWNTIEHFQDANLRPALVLYLCITSKVSVNEELPAILIVHDSS
jgi:hypothetical protein